MSGTRDGTAPTESVLTFELQTQRYCVDTDRVSSVLGIEVDDAFDADDPWHAGTVTVADERIRVVDLARVFSGAGDSFSRGSEPKLIVFDTDDNDGAYYGWLVDDVGKTRTIDNGRVEPIRSGMQYLKARLESEGRPDVLWLDEREINA